MNYRISEKAIADLEQIWLYTFNRWSKAQADRYYQLIIQEIEFIAGHFEFSRKADHIRDGYRVTKVKSHLVFLRKAGNFIEVIRILHENMDIENRLSE